MTQIRPLRYNGKSAGRGTAPGKYTFVSLQSLPASQLECFSVRHDVWSCGSHLVTMRQ